MKGRNVQRPAAASISLNSISSFARIAPPTFVLA